MPSEELRDEGQGARELGLAEVELTVRGEVGDHVPWAAPAAVRAGHDEQRHERAEQAAGTSGELLSGGDADPA